MIKYLVANPTGNITALVLSEVPKSDYIKVASEIMSENKEIEQVGYVKVSNADVRQGLPSVRLDMAAGEFCGNATLSAASYAAYLAGIQSGDSTIVKVSASGANKVLDVRIVSGEKPGSFTGTVEMPAPVSINEYKGMPLVNFDGISHLIADTSAFSRKDALDNIRIIASDLKVPALGILLYDKAQCRIDPLVFVPELDSLVWEHCCASGSCALAAYLHNLDNKNTAAIVSQPGGSLKIEFIDDRILLTGQILLYLPRKS